MTRRPDQNPRHEGEVVNYVHIRGPIISLEEINAALADPKKEKKMTPKRFMWFAKNVFWPWGEIARLSDRLLEEICANRVLHQEVEQLTCRNAELADVADRLARAKEMLASIRSNQVAFLEEKISKFDHDGDGKPGGSKKKAPK